MLKLINPLPVQNDAAGKQFNILLVEDNKNDIILVKENLKAFTNFPYTLTIISDGAEALKYLKYFPDYENQSEPDLVLLDLDLPRKDGWEILREMKENNINIPVCILTGYEQDYEVLNDCTFLTRHFMCKPVDAAKLKILIDSI